MQMHWGSLEVQLTCAVTRYSFGDHGEITSNCDHCLVNHSFSCIRGPSMCGNHEKHGIWWRSEPRGTHGLEGGGRDSSAHSRQVETPSTSSLTSWSDQRLSRTSRNSGALAVEPSSGLVSGPQFQERSYIRQLFSRLPCYFVLCSRVRLHF